MGLFDRLKSTNLETATATVATHSSQNPVTVAKVATVAVASIQKNKINLSDRQKLLAYLASIGESDQATIDEYLEVCSKDADSLIWALAEADKELQLANGDASGLVQCSKCNRLQNNKCKVHRFYVVADKYRKCDDYQQTLPDSTIITCHSCQHFESFYEHGNGAGACGVGVMPIGICWHSETKHECDQYQIS